MKEYTFRCPGCKNLILRRAKPTTLKLRSFCGKTGRFRWMVRVHGNTKS